VTFKYVIIIWKNIYLEAMQSFIALEGLEEVLEELVSVIRLRR
jgi:hypothetical protein